MGVIDKTHIVRLWKAQPKGKSEITSEGDNDPKLVNNPTSHLPRPEAKRGLRDYIKMVHILIVSLLIELTIPAYAYSQGQLPPKPQSMAQDSLTLNQCIDIALRNSPQVAITKGNISKAKINLRDAQSGFLPQVNLSGGYGINNLNNRFAWDEKHYSLSLSASMNPFASGKKLINVAKSKTSLSSVREGYRLTKASLVLEVTRKYYSLLKAEELLGLKIQSLNQRRTHLDFAQTQYGLGLVPRADVLKAEVDLASAQVDSLQAVGNLGLARAELNDKLGLSLDYPVEVKSVKLAKAPPSDLDSCLTQALAHRPELAQQRLNLSIMKDNLKLAEIDRLPLFTLKGSYNVYADRFVFGGVPLNHENWERNRDWQVGLGLSFPIFDGGVGCRAIQGAKIGINEAKLNYEELERGVKLEVKSAHLNLVTSLKRIELTDKQVKSARESYEVALGRYKTGVAPITEVIDAEVALTSSKVNHISAIYDYLLAKTTLQKAMDKLF